MSVRRNDYVVVGVKLPWSDDVYGLLENDHYDNGYKPEITEHNGLTMIADGMDGKYIIVGKVLAKSMDYDGLPMTECRATDIMRCKVKTAVRETLNIDDPEVRVWAFTHWH